MKHALIGGIALLGLPACGVSDPLDSTRKGATGSEARVVVAVVDSAFNPYHNYFRAGSIIYPDSAPVSVTQAVLEEFRIPPENQLELTHTGDFAFDIANDEELWTRIKPGQFYWFKGTNLIGISFCSSPNRLKPTPEKDDHGVPVSGAVLKANPEAVLLVVEDYCGSDTPATEFGAPESEPLALSHPAVDVVSFSFYPAVPAGIPSGSAYSGVVEQGKLLFQCIGNEPRPAQADQDSGSWWTIGIGGISEDNGQTLQAANFPDFVSAYDDRELPHCLDCEDELGRFGGTSNSTPRAAGVASRVLLEARRRLGHSGGIVTAADGRPAMVAAGGRIITNWDLRRALEEAAYADYGPEDYLIAPLDTFMGAPINPAAPWLQLGWGDLTPEPEKGVVDKALAHLGLGAPARTKPAGYCDFQTANMIFRQQHWGRFGPVPDPNPYLFCGSALSR